MSRCRAATVPSAVSFPLLEQLRARFPRVAVVHDWLTIPGGSEQVVLELLEMFPAGRAVHLDLRPRARGRRRSPSAPVHASWLNRIPGRARHYPKLLPLMNRAFRSFDLSGFDLVLSSNHACAKNVRTPPGALHVCYCHTPMRYAWEEGFLEGEEVGRAHAAGAPAAAGAAAPPGSRGRPAARMCSSPTRATWRSASSAATGAPPRSSTRRWMSSTSSACRASRAPTYLVFGRVVPYKRVDLAVAACARLGRR